jgi:hypothetical protein
VSCITPLENPRKRVITIRLHHHERHKPYVVESVFGIPMMMSFDEGGREEVGSVDEDQEGDSNGDEDAEEPEEDDQSPVPVASTRIAQGRTFEERFRDHIQTLRDFCDGLEYQVQFNDHRMLETLEREGGSFLRFARECLMQERAACASEGEGEGEVTNSRYFPIQTNHMPDNASS